MPEHHENLQNHKYHKSVSFNRTKIEFLLFYLNEHGYYYLIKMHKYLAFVTSSSFFFFLIKTVLRKWFLMIIKKNLWSVFVIYLLFSFK